jgi:hypothetical protein
MGVGITDRSEGEHRAAAAAATTATTAMPIEQGG